ncbi:hypothetical protein EIP86_009986 [Pleurotus ostreatoroseus]|nr:hypothetical protein EIP86_009986 [Pleurotus ostreatoroseus]
MTSDLAIGSLHYRGSISMLTGWIHHTVYIFLITFVVLPRNFAPLFALCCVLELPTFLLALGNLVPRLRSDYLFAAVFFLTRIVMHIHIALAYLARALRHGETYVPTLFLACILPMHVLWMRDCVAGILRRRRAAQAAALKLKLSQTQRMSMGAEGGASVPLWLARTTVWLPLPLRQIAVSGKARAEAAVRARRVAWRTSRARVLRMLHEALRRAEAEEGQLQQQRQDQAEMQAHTQSATGDVSITADAQTQTHPHVQPQSQPQTPQRTIHVQLPSLSSTAAAYASGAPRWRSIRRRVAGRIRRSLPEPVSVYEAQGIEDALVPMGMEVSVAAVGVAA